VLLEDDGADDSSSTVMASLDVVSGADGFVQVTPNLQARLNALMEITRALGKALALDDVLPKVLSSLFKIFLQADRGFIVLRGEDGSLVPRWTKARRLGQDETIRISRTIVRRVMESKEAILSHDVTKDDRLDMSQSIADLRIRSMMCAPLLDSEGNPLGVLQVDTLDQRKRFQAEDLEVLITVAIQAGIAVHNAQLHERALKQKELQQDLELAKEVQKAFLPQKRPQLPGYEFFDFYRPMIFVGGDYYDYIALPDGRTAVIVADVVGHGIAAAMMMAKVSAEAKFCLASESRPATAITMLNNQLCAMQIDRFVTLVTVVLDPVKHEATIVNCGHMAPVWRRFGAVIEEPGEDLAGLPLGIMEGVAYRQATITLEAGDVLAMYTDGINEAMNPKGQQYTIERIRGHVKAGGTQLQAIGQTIVDEVLAHVGTGAQTDDMCLVLLQRK
jgi:serine phosphatase RsbU (regulator of sigma subunit)